MISVITNSVVPDGEDRLVADAAGGQVALGGRGDERRHRLHRLEDVDVPTEAAWPAAISTTIVSPTAREKPSTTEATMPESAAGKTTRSVVWSFEAPSPKEPSRSDCGTADIESSEIDAIVGTIMKPMMMPGRQAR